MNLQSTSLFKLLLLYILVTSSINVHSQEQLTNLPTFYITTENNQSIVEKKTWVPGHITIKSSESNEEMNDVGLDIRGRGNSTWGFAKKPYRIKFNSKTNLLQLPAREKNWVLLANYADKTLIRNAVAFHISRIIGMEYTPSARFVDVYLNNNFLGNYMVTDQTEVATYRVPVEKQDETDTEEPQITGGYLLEIDGFASSEPVWFNTPHGVPVTVKYPKDDEINNQQLNYIRNYIRNYETILFSSKFTDSETGYRAITDTQSLVNWYIACELTGNSDSFWSTFLYKKREDDKLYFGPLWDFDIAFNNDNRLGDATYKLMRTNAHNYRTWILRFWQDEWFQQAVAKRWQELVDNNIEENILSYIDELTALIDESQQKNYEKWQTLNQRVHYEYKLFSTYQEGIDFLKEYISKRINFLSTSFEIKAPSEPFVVENYYYKISNVKTMNAIEVINSSKEENALLQLWTARRENNDNQLWEIKELEKDIYRFINKNSGLAIAGNGRANNLKQVTPNDNDNSQKWKITPVLTDNIYGIENLASKYSMNNSGGSYDNGTPVIEYDNRIAESENQQWVLTKVEEIKGENSIDNTGGADYNSSVYPNPATDIVNVQLTLQTHEDISISMYNLSGKLTYRNIYTGLSASNYIFEINLSDMQIQSGTYVLQINISNGQRFTHKLIVR